MTEISLQMDITSEQWKVIGQATIGPKMYGLKLSRENPLSVTIEEWDIRLWFQNPNSESKQISFDAGYLLGSFKSDQDLVSENVFSNLAGGKADEETSLALSPIVKQIANIVARFLQILKSQYNQYWIKEMNYDRRIGNTGYYAMLLGL
jgi:hypothetical protein